MTYDNERQLDEIIAAYLKAQEEGHTVLESDIIAAHPDLGDELRSFFDNLGQLDNMASPLETAALSRSPELESIRYFDDYELLEEIARGGMGVVYKARQTSLNRMVAVKLILTGHLAGDSEVKRFKAEAESAANLKHPHIVAVHEVGQYLGQNYFSMDFIEGRNLSSIVRENPLPARKAARYVQEIAEAIDYAHQQGTLHRDLKPSNVLIDQNDNVQITDFGLATRVEGDSELTRTGQILGTPSYMPPEQAQSQRDDIGPASDVYSIGAILYELLTGRPPFRAESAIETLKQVVETEPLSPRLLNPNVPKDLSTICLKCLRKEPHKRYATAAELAADLRRFQNSEPILARPVSLFEKAWLWCRRRPEIVATASVAIVILVAAILVLNERRNDAEATRIVNGLLQADTSQVKKIIQRELPGFRKWAEEDLRQVYLESSNDSNAKLHAALALLPEDDAVLPFLTERLLTVSPTQFEFVRDLMKSHKEQLIDGYLKLVRESGTDSARRFQAACALATYDTQKTKKDTQNRIWQDEEFCEFLVGHLVSVRPSELQPWRNALRPVKDRLTKPLAAIYRDDSQNSQFRSFAADTLADFLSADPEALFDLLADANHTQFDLLLGQLARHRARAIELGQAELARTLDDQDVSDERAEALAVRQANAAIMLLRLDAAEDAWPVLRHSADPSARTYVIHWLKHRDVAPEAIITRYEQETDDSIKRALLQCLGEYAESQVTESRRQPLIETIQAEYLNHPDPGLHGSAKWLLKKWDVTLPELPVGEPALTVEQEQRIEKLTAKVKDLRKKITDSEKQLATRQLAWEQELSEQPELAAHLNQGLVAHFPLDETEGRETASGIDGQTSAIYYGRGQLEWVAGVLGYAAQLDDQPGSFGCREEFSPERFDAFSFGCWFLADNLPANTMLVSKMDPILGRGFNLVLNGYVLMVQFRHKNGEKGLVVRADVRPSQDTWHHVFVAYDGSSRAAGIKIYLDGRPVDTTYLEDSLSQTIQNRAPLIFGLRETATPFQGRIDDVRLYKRLLDEYEVGQLYLAGLRSLAQVPDEQRTPERQKSLEKFYRSLDEPLRSLENQLAAAETALREIDFPENRHWYVNSQGQTFAIIKADEFQMGSPESEPGRDPLERLHQQKIGRLVAIADTEVTRAQFREFVKSEAGKYTSMGPDNPQVANLAPTDDSPTMGVNWFAAAQYCNWLSEQEGIPREQWCYEPNRDGEYSLGMKAKDNFWELTGYRLPTEAEWEFACRSGTKTTRFYGRTEKLLPEYAWYYDNGHGKPQVWPVANRKPNDFGLFDMYGNVWEWVYNPWHEYESSSTGYVVDEPRSSVISGRVFHGLRGGTTRSHPSSIRSAFRGFDNPGPYDLTHGFRPCRTFYFSAEDSPSEAEVESTPGDLEFLKSVVRPEMGKVVGLEISPDGQFVYAASWDTGSIDVFERDAETGDLTHRQQISHPDRTHGVTAVRLSRDGRLAVASAHISNTVILFARNSDSGELSKLDVERDGEQGASGLKWAMDATFSPDSPFLYVIASKDAAVTWFRIIDGKSLEFTGVNRGENQCFENARGICMSPDGKTLYVASAGAGTLTVLRINTDTGEPVVQEILRNGNGIIGLDGVFSVTCSSDGQFIYTNSGCFGGDHAVCVFKHQPNGTLKLVEVHRNGFHGVEGLRGGNELVISPDERNLYALGSKAGAVACFDRDTDTGKLTYRRQLVDNINGVGHLGGVSGIAVSPKGRHVYAAAQNNNAISIFRRH